MIFTRGITTTFTILRETALGIGLEDEIANSVMAALGQGKSCWLEVC